MFGRRKKDRGADPGTPPPPAEVYLGLRNQILGLDPSAAGLADNGDNPVWGFVMETGYPKGTATLVCLKDGTTSLYTSSGGGIIGGGEHAQIADASKEVIRVAGTLLDLLPPGDDRSLPAPGRVRMHVLTFDGPKLHDAAEDDLGYERDAVSPLFHAAHSVITRVRLYEESRSR